MRGQGRFYIGVGAMAVDPGMPPGFCVVSFKRYCPDYHHLETMV
jgi:hypothetical protein